MGCKVGEVVVGNGLGSGVTGVGCNVGALVTGDRVVGWVVAEKLGAELGERDGLDVGPVSEVGCGLGSNAHSDVLPIG